MNKLNLHDGNINLPIEVDELYIVAAVINKYSLKPGVAKELDVS